MTLGARCEEVEWVASTNGKSHVMETFRIPVIEGRFNPKTSVAVAVLSKMRAKDAVAAKEEDAVADVMSYEFMDEVAHNAERHGVRFLMGVFSGDQAEMAKLCETCGVETRPYCQVWRHPVGEEDTAVAIAASEEGAAVAAKEEVEAAPTEDEADFAELEQKEGQEEKAAVAAEAGKAQCGAVFPAYVLVLGPCARHRPVGLDNAPAWPDWLCRDGRFEKRLVPLSRLPGATPPDRSCDQALARRACLARSDLAMVKQKVAGLRWWAQGVHQVVLWVGRARQGLGAREAQLEKKGKGPCKGRGAKGKRGRKGNRGKKGQMW